MMTYQQAYETATGKRAPQEAAQLAKLFDRIAAGEVLPPRGQQAVDLGLTAHSLNDPQENPAVYDYYRWVLTNCFQPEQITELTAKLIGRVFTCANVFQTDLPQPLTINPWQVTAMRDFPLRTDRAIIVENNGVFAWLLQLHPDWPLINQSGNDFNTTYLALIQSLEQRHVALTYLGDLDSRGIQMADHLFSVLRQTPIATFTAIQSPVNVVQWLTLKGKANRQRTRSLAIQNSVFQKELNSLNLLGKFVEQEQLIATYEPLVTQWLAKSESGPKGD
ncbi:DUF2399 domain-containing protein [Levilactobacillus suantsaiihabitans]|uniref:DUF2399 domain-containing protein n=1 Tax=Levilactobacillus suantsaiihabitans TaxID=2487722 RepID=A0A4Z0JB53_9LACO|nr:DUF2399 domain-containing protein [Levilactobacillus suantsaiihabitans]TGD18374.1 DUF2399 domain-containing protein [Levilactobacillus suantsaiihabitans]